MLPSPAPYRRGTTSALLLSAALLLLGGLALVMGGAVRWLGCLTPDVWAVACPMHDDAFGELPGIDLPVAAGYALVGAAALPASFGLRPGRGARGRWALPALGLLTLLVHVAFAVGTLEPGEPGEPGGPGEPASALGQASSLLVLLVPVLSVTGAALVTLGRDDTPGRLTARWTGGTLAAVGLAHGIVPIVVLIGVSGSHDDPPGLFLLPGLVTLVLVGLLTAAAVRASHRWNRRALLATLAGVTALLAAGGWAAAGAILWRDCLEPGSSTTGCAPAAAAAARAPLERERWPEVTPQPEVALGAGLVLLAAAAALALLHALLERSAPGWTAAAAAVLAAGAGAVLASRAGTVVLAESAFALVLALLGMVLAWRAGVSGVHGSRGSQSARSPVASA